MRNFFLTTDLNCRIEVLTLCLHTILSLPIPTDMGYARPETLLTYISKYI